MKNTIVILLILGMGIFLVSAIYPGECDTIEFPNSNPVQWKIEGNTTNITDFSYNQTGTTIDYCFGGGFPPGEYKITFFNEEEVNVIVSGGGGGGCSSRCSSNNEEEDTPKKIFDSNGCSLTDGFYFCEPRGMCITSGDFCDEEIILDENKDIIEEVPLLYKIIYWVVFIVLCILLAVHIPKAYKEIKELIKKKRLKNVESD